MTGKTPKVRQPQAWDVEVGRRIRARRLERKMSQTELGKPLGVTFQQIQKYEKGRNRVSAARLFEICEALDVSLASMFERKLKDYRLGIFGHLVTSKGVGR
jgi:transcriptional regulator with XRE-family HTH domain